jgi:hypothetical protein
MKMRMSLILPLLIATSFVAKSQDTTATKNRSKLDLGLEGMIGLSFGNEFYALNVGGPALFLALNKDLKIGIGAFPSLYLLDDRLGARLGVSPRIDYKNLVVMAPFYHRDRTETWIWSVGLGYKFHKKN